jgi:hypothetical protein
MIGLAFDTWTWLAATSIPSPNVISASISGSASIADSTLDLALGCSTPADVVAPAPATPRTRLQARIHKPKVYSDDMVCDSRMSPDLPRGTGKSIGGDLDIDDEGSEQRRFEPVQSLNHSSVGYQPVHTRIGLAKKAMFLQVN